MANDKLENLVKIGKLKAEKATPDEVAGLIRSGVARLADARKTTLSLESRFDLAIVNLSPTHCELFDHKRTTLPKFNREESLKR